MSLPTRDEAWDLVCEWIASDSLRKHVLGVEAGVLAYARRFGGNEALWGVTALSVHYLLLLPARVPHIPRDDPGAHGHPRGPPRHSRAHDLPPQPHPGRGGTRASPWTSRARPGSLSLLGPLVTHELTGLIMAVAYVCPSKQFPAMLKSAR